MPTEASLTSSLQTLALLPPTDPTPPTDPSLYPTLAKTIAEELDPTFTATASLEHSLEPLLRRLGYTGDATSPLPVLNFLIPTLQAHRILTHRSTTSQPPPRNRDALLAASVSRLQAALPHPQRAPPHDASQLAALLNSLVVAAANRVSLLGGPDKAFGHKLLPSDQIVQHSDPCETVRKELIKEHNIRKDLLLHRLQVTVRAFSQSDRADRARFATLLHRVRRQAEEQGEVSTFEALAAREWALRREHFEPDPHAQNVKNVVMGTVPDRGGRVGRTQGAQMPRFTQRVPTSVERRKGKRDGGGKGKAGKRRRGRT